MTFSGFDLPDDLAMLRDVVHRFVSERIWPAEAALPPDARRLPDDVLQPLRAEARALGLWCMDAPAEHGGGGLSAFESVVVWEQACKHRFCFPIAGGGVFGHTPPVVLYAGTPSQIDTWVKPAIAEGRTGFSAVAEPSGGTDPARAIRTTATRDGDDWVLNGTKLWITHADHAEYGVVYARTENGVSAFVLDTSTPGIEVRPIPMMRDSWPCEVQFHDCHLPGDALIGAEGAGLTLAGTWLVKGRLSYAARAVGVAEESMRLAAAWADERETFGAPLASRQAIQFAFADSRAEVNAARWLTWEAAWLSDQKRPEARRAAAIAKLTATETGFRVVDRMMQVLGAMGLSRELPLESWFRDLRAARLIEGASEILRDIVARDELHNTRRKG
ncbi:MAG: acyl-CoA dehydrogenase family protein [Acidobacteria bacterium]|nr:acyl-CoA dehydrogenase family protein [Acidobacteriota bacterium]